MHYPPSWDPYFKPYLTLADLYHSAPASTVLDGSRQSRAIVVMSCRNSAAVSSETVARVSASATR